jgi:raffinose/stachyose/melibiose transport system permease protein
MRVSKTETVMGRLLLVVLMVVTIIPFVSMFLTALHPAGTYPNGISWPADPQWGNFVEAFTAARMGELLWSSSLIVIGVVPVSLAIAAMAGFAFGQLRLPGERWIFFVFLLGLALPFEGILTPLYYQIREMGLLNTRWAIILPLIALFMPFSVLWMRTSFSSIPHELFEASQLDGANSWQTFWRVHVPLSTPALSSLGILLFLWTWNQFLLALVLVDDPLQRTMAGALGAFQGQFGTDIPLLCAGSLIIMTPTLVVFFIFQRKFVAALLQGSIKG